MSGGPLGDVFWLFGDCVWSLFGCLVTLYDLFLIVRGFRLGPVLNSLGISFRCVWIFGLGLCSIIWRHFLGVRVWCGGVVVVMVAER